VKRFIPEPSIVCRVACRDYDKIAAVSKAPVRDSSRYSKLVDLYYNHPRRELVGLCLSLEDINHKVT
jgi:hypothetical protein